MAEKFQKDFQKEKSRDSENGQGGGSGDEEIKKQGS